MKKTGDRSQELRNIMKLTAAKQSLSVKSTNISSSGKDKVQLLKSLKEKEKGSNAINISTNNKQSVIMSAVSSSSELPNDFFDEGSVVQPPSINASSINNPPPVPAKEEIPVGFFDDPVDDLAARGLTIKQQVAKKEEMEKKELDALISEISVITERELSSEALEAEYEKDESFREYEESEIQMAYITKLASLYRQSDKLTKKDKYINEELVPQSFIESIEKAEEESYLLLQTDPSDVVATIDNKYLKDMESILYTKLQEEETKLKKKRKLEEKLALLEKKELVMDDEDDNEEDDDDEDDKSYSPFDYM